MRSTKPVVSVIVTTKNEEKNIVKLLGSIMKQTFKNFEIIVVDNNSSDQTKTIVGKYTDKVYNFGPERSAQRNYGAKKAKGRYLLFLDADMELSPSVIKECLEVYRKNRDSGGVAIPEHSRAKRFWEKVKAFERSFYNEKGDPITDAARFFRKEVFFDSGGYDETITGPEDWDLPETIREQGFRIERIEAPIYHRERISSPFDLAKKKFYYAKSAYRYLQKHKISLIGPKTIYFLRPVFYKNFYRILTHPILSVGMFLMLSLELLGGSLGFLIGKLQRK